MNEKTIHIETCEFLRGLEIPFVTMDWRGENLPERKARAMELKSFGGAGIPDLLIPIKPKIIVTEVQLGSHFANSEIYPNGLVIEFKSLSLTGVFNKDGSIIYSRPKNSTLKARLKSWHNLIQFAFMGFFISKGFYATYAANTPPYGLIENWIGLDWPRKINHKNLHSPVDFFGMDGCQWSFTEAVKEHGPLAYKGEYGRLPCVDWSKYD